MTMAMNIRFLKFIFNKIPVIVLDNNSKPDIADRDRAQNVGRDVDGSPLTFRFFPCSMSSLSFTSVALVEMGIQRTQFGPLITVNRINSIPFITVCTFNQDVEESESEAQAKASESTSCCRS